VLIFLPKISPIKRKKDDAVRHQHTQAYKSRLQELVPKGITMQYWAIYQWSSCVCRLASLCKTCWSLICIVALVTNI